jgi:2-polyprenyl-6-methoxyphenol hydroxylase-like FAD-dependent oxidoreductase
MVGSCKTLGLGRAGHRVTILEAASDIGEVGAGIQVAPNATRILGRWGLLEELAQSAVELSGVSIRRWQDDEVLGELPLMPMVYHNRILRKLRDEVADSVCILAGRAEVPSTINCYSPC